MNESHMYRHGSIVKKTCQMGKKKTNDTHSMIVVIYILIIHKTLLYAALYVYGKYEIIARLKKEGNYDTCYDTNER